MKIINAAFIRSVSALQDLPDERVPEIVFAGRSNVGKSSLLNSLTGRKGLAKTSSTPGKTRLLNYFLINDDLYFVDIPGYGYAAVSHTEKDAWGRLLAGYVGGRQAIALVVLLLDSRHPAMESDREMMEFLAYHDRPYGIVLTKDDKLTQKERAKAKRVTASCALNAEFIVSYSSISGKGKKELLAHFDHYLSGESSGAGSDSAVTVT
ncbi:ribosome biogenesis GTP-binding protein YihA/YsxC [Pelodictyon luteolum]|uniref:Probable GTP-binding protein EngB n=1 Tax=Chlorobium luteolum (strain DSM 273 / BCRC 81028 / 2530) TaxID=319225 RepID=ENGB_CHLL3|nr:ribosome biogenesis GTP-binding protein YihA/YsxC [Pelodictyon luteolum]Q3B6D1.1 RecName: Full=Probable GTP-binding protein EngB [Pelodictyon luteolum DSM 273]ABB23100.1 GTP-binding protein [Pelodictyon luteolum DSM 273]